MTKGYESLQSVARAITVLKSFTFEMPERGVNELSRELQLHKSTVSRLVTTLERGGLLARVPENGHYRLGIDLIQMAEQVVALMDVREVARPLLRQLAETCLETANLAVWDIGQVIDVEQFPPTARQVKNVNWARWRMDPHCTAAGKVFLAYFPPDEQERHLQVTLARLTPHTITDREVLRSELARAREQGYAVAQGELEEGLNAVAAPVFDHRGQVVAAPNIAGPAYRVTPELFSDLAARLIETARRISEQLGYKGAWHDAERKVLRRGLEEHPQDSDRRSGKAGRARSGATRSRASRGPSPCGRGG